MEYRRGWRRPRTSAHSCGPARMPNSAATSTAWRPQHHRASSPLLPGRSSLAQLARVAGAVRGEPQQAGSYAGDVQVTQQGIGEGHVSGAADLNGRARVEPGDGQPLRHEVRPVDRVHRQGVPGLVGQRGVAVAGVEGEAPDLLAGAGQAQQPVAGEAGGGGDGTAPAGTAAAGPERRLLPGGRPLGALQRGEHLVEPGSGRVLVVRFAVGARGQPYRVQLFHALVEAPAVAAEVVVGGVAEGQDGVAPAVSRGAPGDASTSQNPAPLSGASPSPERARDQQQVGVVGQRRGVRLGHGQRGRRGGLPR